jgi:hydrogenase maturation factor HypE
LGLLGYSTRDTMEEFDYAYDCQLYSDTMLDSFLDTPWRLARAMAILGNVASGIVALTSIVMSCMSVSQSVIRILIFLLVVTSVAELLTFLVFASDICRDYGCRLSVSARLAIASSIMAFVTAVVFARIQSVSNGNNNYPSSYIVGEAPGTVTIEETVHPDGTKTIVKTTANADGSKTVEETVERPVSHDAYATTAAVTNTKEEQVIARPTVVTY